jgi:ergothioneine biosynthesis protein EgtB
MEAWREELLDAFRDVRQKSLQMCAPLEPEDFQVQPSEEVSPPKWNIGHTSWFFWHFLLRPRGISLPVDEGYAYLLNSYYHKAGLRGLRGRRGIRTRPTIKEIYSYRESVDRRMEKLILETPDKDREEITFMITVGVNHEQQHQELFHTEIKNIYFANPVNLRPAYKPRPETAVWDPRTSSAEFIPFRGGVFDFGNVDGGWCWDNELQVHKAVIDDFALQSRLVTNAEYMEFIEDGGYDNSLFWLSDGWFEIVERQEWRAPLYWEKIDGKWLVFTLSGMLEVVPADPVCHVSFYEARAFAQWKSQVDSEYRDARLPTEREWEFAARKSASETAGCNLFERGVLHPSAAGPGSGRLLQMLGDVWEWTSSHYEPYPGFVEFPNDLSEYNGKFMNNQRVLRGGSCVTPESHIRVSYRNFWPPATRFQFAGFRLAKKLS